MGRNDLDEEDADHKSKRSLRTRNGVYALRKVAALGWCRRLRKSGEQQPDGFSAPPPRFPTSRSDHRMVYDTKDKRILMHGGFVAGQYSRETWSL